MRWRTIAFLLMGFACQLQTVLAASLAKSKATEMNYDVGGKSVQWSGGALSVVEANASILPFVRLFGRDGRQLAGLAVSIPQATIVTVSSVARGNNGLVAMVGSAGEFEGRGAGFIALYPPDGSARKVISITYDVYVPIFVAVAEDGSVWTAGLPRGKSGSDHNVFWHFDTLGNKIGSAVDAASFSSSLAIRGAVFTASPQGLIFVSQRDGRYLELSPGGGVTTDIAVNLPSTATGFVAAVVGTEDGQRFVEVQFVMGSQSTQPPHLIIYSVDVKSGNLAVVADSPDFLIFGAERNTLMGYGSGSILELNIVP